MLQCPQAPRAPQNLPAELTQPSGSPCAALKPQNVPGQFCWGFMRKAQVPRRECGGILVYPQLLLRGSGWCRQVPTQAGSLGSTGLSHCSGGCRAKVPVQICCEHIQAWGKGRCVCCTRTGGASDRTQVWDEQDAKPTQRALCEPLSCSLGLCAPPFCWSCVLSSANTVIQKSSSNNQIIFV